MIRVVCVLKSGGEYRAEHVAALRDMCRAWLPPHFFVCLTDVRGLPCQTEPLRHNLKGWWSKMELFRAFTHGPTLFFDLDTILQGDCQRWCAEELEGKPFAILRDLYHPEHMQSAVMYWEGDQSWIWQEFESRGNAGFRGDQDFLEDLFKRSGFSPYLLHPHPCRLSSYKVCKAHGEVPTSPIVVFHGQPRPWAQKDIPYPAGCVLQPERPCLVVGNGPSSLTRKLGHVVDAFDTVIRINAYRVQGFEKHVGSKTTVHATHGKRGAVSAEPSPGRLLWLHGHPAWESTQWWLVPQSFYWSLVSAWAPDKSILPSSGYITVAWLLQQGIQQVHLLGMDHFSKKQSGLHHYWHSTASRQPKEHAPEREAEVFRQWWEQGRVAYL